MTARQLFLAAYDIRDPGRLRRTLHVLKDFSCGGQKSVFECYLTPAERLRLLHRVSSVIDLEADAFLVVPLRRQSPVRTLGMSQPLADENFLYFG